MTRRAVSTAVGHKPTELVEVTCKICRQRTTRVSRRLCQTCDDLQTLVKAYPDRARYILASLNILGAYD